MPKNRSSRWGGTFFQGQIEDAIDDKADPYEKTSDVSFRAFMIGSLFTLAIIVTLTGMLVVSNTLADPYAQKDFRFGFFLIIIGPIGVYFSGRMLYEIHQDNRERVRSDIRLKELKEASRLAILRDMPYAELQRLAYAAKLTEAELTVRMYGESINNAARWEQYKDARADQIRYEEYARSDRAEARATQERQETRSWYASQAGEERIHKENESKADRQHKEVLARMSLERLKYELDTKLKQLSLEHTHAQKMRTLREISDLRVSMISSLQVLRDHPALEGQITQVVMALDSIYRYTEKFEAETPEAINQREIFENLLIKLLNNHMTMSMNGSKPNGQTVH